MSNPKLVGTSLHFRSPSIVFGQPITRVFKFLPLGCKKHDLESSLLIFQVADVPFHITRCAIFALIYHTASLSCIYMYYSHKQILNMFPVYLSIIGTIVICSYMSLGFISFLIFVATQNMAYNLQKAGVTINMARKG